jgi:hypothetical protein
VVQVIEQLEERLLQDVFRVAGVTQHAATEPEQRRAMS